MEERVNYAVKVDRNLCVNVQSFREFIVWAVEIFTRRWRTCNRASLPFSRDHDHGESPSGGVIH